MNCLEVQELLSAYHDDELADGDRSRVAEHIAGCPDCQKEIAGFEKLSDLAGGLSRPVPAQQWRQLERELEGHSGAKPSVHPALITRTRFVLAVAATVLLAAMAGLVAYRSSLPHGAHPQFTADFAQYLDEFRSDPAGAQQILLAKYANQLVNPADVIKRIGYRPMVADGLPEGYTLESTQVVTMPCCTCVQSICKRSDGSTLAVFEHDDEETAEWFGDRPDIAARCGDTMCCLVQLEDQIAASWKVGSRHITLIGVRDVEEVSEIVAWSKAPTRLAPE